MGDQMFDNADMAVLGKLGDGVSGSHPLACHMLDVAAVAGALWDRVLSGGARSRLAAWIGEGDIAAGRQAVCLLAGLHDLGKASPAFQLGTLPDTPERRSELSSAGLAVPSEVLKRRRDGLAKSVVRDALESLGFDSRTACDAGVLLSGHHGLFAGPEVVPGGSPSAGDGTWRAYRRRLAGMVMEALVATAPVGRMTTDAAAGMLFAGLVSVADWIGSDTDNFPFATSEASDLRGTPVGDYAEESRRKALASLGRLGWGSAASWPEADGGAAAPSFEESFGRAPYKVQSDAEALARSLGSPSIVIIEAPMGEGKTEAALHAADILASRGLNSGLYFGLPTQATTDQMFVRVRNTLARRHSGEVVELQLAHGHRMLNRLFAAMLAAGDASAVRAAMAPDSLSPSGVDIDGAGAAANPEVVASSWFNSRKRSLLAAHGVGTVDQALTAALTVPHVFVRLFGLAGKVVIIDEVHSYDPYMNSLLERLVEWLAALGSSVILLSATLPDARRRRLLASYGRGAGTGMDASALPGAAYPRISWLTSGGEAGAGTSPATPARARVVAVSRVADPLAQDGAGETVLDAIIGAAAEGACVVAVMNTVRRAQELHSALRARIGGDGTASGVSLDLLHARYPQEDRARREAALVGRYDRAAADDDRRPRGEIVVATQIVEQSLDLDFDLLVSDLAPIDAICQRLGRVHRHSANDPRRPARFAAPAAWIVDCGHAGGVPVFEAGTKAVYRDDHALLRTAMALEGRDSIALPGDIESLIEAVYSPLGIDEALAGPLAGGRGGAAGDGRGGGPTEGLRQEWEGSATRRDKLVADLEGAAATRRIRSPRAVGRPEYDEFTARHTAEGELGALTRWGLPSVSVVCLQAGEDGPAAAGETGGPRPLPLFEGAPLDLRKGRLPRALTARLVARSISVSHRGLAARLLAEPAPEAFARSPLLFETRVVILDKTGSAVIPPVGERGRQADIAVSLDPVLGFCVSHAE